MALRQGLCPHGSGTNPISAAASASGIPGLSGDLVAAAYPREELEEPAFSFFLAICLPVGAGFVCGQRARWHTEQDRASRRMLPFGDVPCLSSACIRTCPEPVDSHAHLISWLTCCLYWRKPDRGEACSWGEGNRSESCVSAGAASWPPGGSFKAAQMGLHKTVLKRARVDDSRCRKGKSHKGQRARRGRTSSM